MSSAPMRLRWVLATAVTVLAYCLAPASASSAASNRSPVAPNAFQVQGSNGYSVSVSGRPAFRQYPAAVAISVSRGEDHASYSAPATVTETSIQADLGELGEIDVTFHNTGQTKTVHPKCGQPFSYETGYFEGKIVFHGEEGFTEVEATSAKAGLDFVELCGSLVSGSFHPPTQGAELYIRNPALGPRFSVVKQRPSDPALFGVAVSEYRDGISIERYLSRSMPPGTFRYDQRLQTAAVHPGAPFSGTATFNRHRRANRRWQGDLAVDMPGRADVPLTGPALRAYLVRPST